MKHFVFSAVAALVLLAGCERQVGRENGTSFAVSAADGSVIPVMIEALKRGNDNALIQPFTTYVYDANGQSTALYELAWDGNARRKVKWKKATADEALERASFKILSTEGMSPFYDYCFGSGNHAQIATHFCTVTLIEAMKAHRGNKERAAEATRSSQD